MGKHIARRRKSCRGLSPIQAWYLQVCLFTKLLLGDILSALNSEPLQNQFLQFNMDYIMIFISLQRKTSTISKIYQIRHRTLYINHHIHNLLPIGGNILILQPLKASHENDFTQEEDELAIYIAQAFAELRSLERQDPIFLLRDTIKFVINTTTKAKPGNFF